MNVSPTPELEGMINSEVASGMYNSASEVVREGLRLIQQRDAMYEKKLADLRADEAEWLVDSPTAMARRRERLLAMKENV